MSSPAALFAFSLFMRFEPSDPFLSHTLHVPPIAFHVSAWWCSVSNVPRVLQSFLSADSSFLRADLPLCKSTGCSLMCPVRFVVARPYERISLWAALSLSISFPHTLSTWTLRYPVRPRGPRLLFVDDDVNAFLQAIQDPSPALMVPCYHPQQSFPPTAWKKALIRADVRFQ